MRELAETTSFPARPVAFLLFLLAILLPVAPQASEGCCSTAASASCCGSSGTCPMHADESSSRADGSAAVTLEWQTAEADCRCALEAASPDSALRRSIRTPSTSTPPALPIGVAAPQHNVSERSAARPARVDRSTPLYLRHLSLRC